MILDSTAEYSYDVPNADESFFKVFDSFAPPEIIEKRRLARESERIAQEFTKRRLTTVRRSEQQRFERLYVDWQRVCEITFKGKARNFPHLPREASFCKELSCVERKTEKDGLGACKHEVEKLLRASGRYSVEWLRSQRLNWHPDRMGQRFEPRFRAVAIQKATAMYQTFEELLREERARNGEDV